MALSFVLLCAAVVLIPLYIRFRFRRSSKNALQLQWQHTEWPLLGVLIPSIICVLNRNSFHDAVTAIAVAKLFSFRVHAPRRTGLSYFVTCDPENVRHVFTRSFANYPKGGDFAAAFPLLEGTIFTADGEQWRRQRRRIHAVLTGAPVRAAVARACRRKVAQGLVPALARVAAADGGGGGAAVDMQDVLGRLVFDMTVMLVFGEDPCCLSDGHGGTAPPPVPVAEALDAVMEVAFFRHTVPTVCWKAMARLGVGPERNVAEAEAVLWDFVAEKIRTRMAAAAAGRQTTAANGEAVGDDILSHYLVDDDDPDCFDDAGQPTGFMHRTFINYLVALRDPVATALPWLVYSLATHPRVVSAVRAELAPIAAAAADGMVVFEPEEVERLVYLRAALFESLRLYPPGPIERKVAAGDDVLPSGHAVRAGDTVLALVYSMGRMESVWGQDCREYRPERWLVTETEGEDGRPAAKAKLRHVPSYKFMAFNTGPRSCIGKSIAVAQMMAVAAAVAWNFDVEVVEGHAVEPKLSVLLQMRNGLMVRVNNRRGRRQRTSSVVTSSS